MLSNENLNIYSSCNTLTRVEKTRLVANFEPAYKYLNVCVRDDNNCGKCFKCLNTLFTLELLGLIDKFSHIFNIENYYKERSKYIAKVIAYQNSDAMLGEIYEQMINDKFKIPVYSRVVAKYFRAKNIIRAANVG